MAGYYACGAFIQLHRPVHMYENGFHLISFEKISVLDSYFIHGSFFNFIFDCAVDGTPLQNPHAPC